MKNNNRKTIITIIVKDGLVQSVYSTDENIEAEVIDLDTTDDEEYDKAVRAAEEAQNNGHLIW